MTKLLRFVGAVVCGSLIWTSPARADVVTDWNVTTVNLALTPSLRPGPSGLLDIAMVHAAMHDAIQAFQGRYQPYHLDIQNASGSPVAAAAAAAHDMLVALFPTQAAALDATHIAYLASNGLTGDPGVGVGQQAAAGILALRGIVAGAYPPVSATSCSEATAFCGGTGIGEWRPTTATPTPMTASWLATAMPFTLRDAAQFRASPPPPSLTSGEYAQDYDEVKALGALNNSARTAAQTDLARFYSDNPSRYWNRALRELTAAHLNDIGDSARLFALVGIAMSDALIATWDTKIYWNFWRPSTAIQQGANDGNPRTVGDPTWQPFFPNPNYPDYTSGANGASGSATRILALFFGTDKVDFSITSGAASLTQNPRNYSRFSDAASDVADARIFMGIHFRFPDVVGRRLGEHVANWAYSHFLRPIRGAK